MVKNEIVEKIRGIVGGGYRYDVDKMVDELGELPKDDNDIKFYTDAIIQNIQTQKSNILYCDKSEWDDNHPDIGHYEYTLNNYINNCKDKYDLSFMNLLNFNIKDYFSNDIIDKDIYFHYAEFNGESYFNRVKFEGKSYFNRVKFEGKSYFRNAIFIKETYFRGAIFNEINSFKDAKFHGVSYFNSAKFHGESFFDDAKFNGGVSFYNSEFKTLANFNETVIKHSFDMRGAIFKGLKYFATIKIENIKDSNRDSFRFLKDHFESSRDFVNANDFYKKENDQWLKELLGLPKISMKILNIFKPQSIILFFGKITSNHLTSWILPVCLFLGISLVSFLCMGSGLSDISNNGYWSIKEAMRFFNNVSMPISPIIDRDYLKAVFDIYPIATTLMKLISSLLIYYMIVTFKRVARRS